MSQHLNTDQVVALMLFCSEHPEYKLHEIPVLEDAWCRYREILAERKPNDPNT